MRCVLYFLFILVFGSCSKFVNVYEVQPVSSGFTTDTYFVYENEVVIIKYSFWRERGVLSYTLYNKMDKPIYIDWKKSSLIRNGQKLDYWNDETFTKSKSNSAFNSGLYFGYYDLLTLSTTITESKSVKPERITFIAPRSAITRSKFVLYDLPYVDMKKPTNSRSIKESKNDKVYDVKYVGYTKENTPLLFRNYITFSATENFEREASIDNEFYISAILKIKDADFMDRTVFNKQTKKYEPYIPFMRPEWFFVKASSNN